MKVYYFNNTENFGDKLNELIWPRLLGDRIQRANDVYLGGIGTIISEDMPLGKKWVIFGCGVGYKPVPNDFDPSTWKILAVRGTLTCRVLGISETYGITDAAIMLANLPECESRPETERRGVIFMPHLTARQNPGLKEACAQLGIEYVDPYQEVSEIIQKLRNSKLVISEAMHAAIVADTLRVPWVPVATSKQISSFKWLDWTSSMNIPYSPIEVQPTSFESKLKSRLSGILQKKYLLDVNTPEAALADYNRRSAIVKNKAFLFGINAFSAGGRTLSSALASVRNRPSLSEGVPVVVEETPAFEALQKALKSTPYLSSEQTFKTNLSRMNQKLDELKLFLDANQ